MSNKRKLRLQPYTPPRQVSISGMEHAGPGERCQFHPDCCDVDDMNCPGCGEPAEVVITARISDSGVNTRTPFCGEHLTAGARWAVEHDLAQRQGEGN